VKSHTEINKIVFLSRRSAPRYLICDNDDEATRLIISHSRSSSSSSHRQSAPNPTQISHQTFSADLRHWDRLDITWKPT